MKLHFFSIAAVLMATGATAAHAQTFTPSITQTIGSGSEESFFTLDFQDGTLDHNYAFGYLYNGTQTGADLLAALSADTALQVGYDAGYGPADGNPAGVFANSFSFNGHSETGSDANYWAYFTGNDGQNWTYSQVGASSRTLSNGSWDGWSWDVGNAYPAPAPVTPAAVPEASSVVSFGLLLGLGLVIIRRSRKSISL
jgi:hypothetical protein